MHTHRQVHLHAHMTTHIAQKEKRKKSKSWRVGSLVRALVALEEDKGSIYNTCMVVHKLHVPVLVVLTASGLHGHHTGRQAGKYPYR